MGLEVFFIFSIILLSGNSLYNHIKINKIKRDIYLVSNNPQLARKSIRKDPRYKNL